MKIEYIEDNVFQEEEPKSLRSIDQKKEKKYRKILEQRKTYNNNPFRLNQKCKIQNKNVKQLITKTKANLLKNNFISKLKRGVTSSKVPDNVQNSYSGIHLTEQSFIQRCLKILDKTQGFQFSNVYRCFWTLINLIQTLIIIFAFSVMLAFQETRQNPYFSYLVISAISTYLLDMIINLIAQKIQMGRKMISLKQIVIAYAQGQLAIDLAIILVMCISLWTNDSGFQIFCLAISFFKFSNKIKDFQQLQYLYIGTTQREQYYGLLKVVLTNFAIGHILSIILNVLAGYNSQKNWYHKIDIQNQYWNVKYIWGYYWGTNIMLTVGFGDLSASNTFQALSLIFIETISCITLAYNINYVGSLIKQMNASREQRKKKLKYFYRMCRQNNIPEQTQTKISNFIVQSYNINEQFQFDQHQTVLNTIPKNLQAQYLKQSNKRLFDVPFFNSLSKRTLINLAQKVMRKISHPGQIIQNKGENAKLSILQTGHIQFVCKNGDSKLNGTTIESFIVNTNQKPKILSLDFVKGKFLAFDIKSIAYSVIYYLQNEDFINILKQCEMDFSQLRMAKDRDTWLLSQNQIYKCGLCANQYHNKVDCPKFHYKPLAQNIIFKHLKREAKFKQERILFSRQTVIWKPIGFIKQLQINQLRYLLQYHDENYIKQTNATKKYYLQKKARDQLTRFLTLHSNGNDCNNITDSQQVLSDYQIKKIQQLFTIYKENALINNFWDIQVDQACNFRFYFPNFNPQKLSRALAPVPKVKNHKSSISSFQLALMIINQKMAK